MRKERKSSIKWKLKKQQEKQLIESEKKGGKEEDGRKGEETEIVDGADKDAGTSVDERTKKETQSTRTANVQNFEAEAATFESSEEDDSEF